MSKRVRTGLIKYGIFAVICVAFALVYCNSREFSQQNLPEKYRILCDAFSIPGLLSLCVGALMWASNDGIFNGLSYCLGVAWKALIPGGRAKTERYYDYVTRRNEKKLTGYGFLLIGGGVCMAVAVVFLILFYRVY